MTFFDGDDDFGDDDEDEYRCKSVNFQARTSSFCMKVCLDNTYNMLTMKIVIIILMLMMIVMIKMIIALSQSIFKLGRPDVAWK